MFTYESSSTERSQGGSDDICPGGQIIYDAESGVYVCSSTGEVIERVIDERQEWRAFTPEEKERRSRVGGPLTSTVHDRGFATAIDFSDKDASGKRLPPRKRYEVQKLRKYQARSRVQSSIERNLAQAMNELDRLADLLHLPRNVREEAARIYRLAVEKGLVRGRSIENVVAAAIYAACRELKVPRTLDEIAKYTRSARKDIARCYRLLLKELDIRVKTSDPIDFIPRIAHTLGLTGGVMKRAAEILNIARERGVTAGKDPAGLAAAAVYIAALELGERRTQKEVAQVAGVTEVTVRNRYKELAKELGIDLPQQ
ncbi:MAG: transcription initiation factor IIB [Thermoprotei archaeon]|nr:MAG: transcription initiation factor IIB [Thermoprotei archaeon]